jgi:hypothetical protein
MDIWIPQDFPETLPLRIYYRDYLRRQEIQRIEELARKRDHCEQEKDQVSCESEETQRNSSTSKLLPLPLPLPLSNIGEQKEDINSDNGLFSSFLSSINMDRWITFGPDEAVWKGLKSPLSVLTSFSSKPIEKEHEELRRKFSSGPIEKEHVELHRKTDDSLICTLATWRKDALLSYKLNW